MSSLDRGGRGYDRERGRGAGGRGRGSGGRRGRGNGRGGAGGVPSHDSPRSVGTGRAAPMKSKSQKQFFKDEDLDDLDEETAELKIRELMKLKRRPGKRERMAQGKEQIEATISRLEEGIKEIEP